MRIINTSLILIICSLVPCSLLHSQNTAIEQSADLDSTTSLEPSAIDSTSEDSYLKMDVKDFFSISQDIFSVSDKIQKLRDTASAVYVLDKEDIRRSASTNLPDLFRLVPGLQVASIGRNAWAISSRGFSDEFNGQLLVLLDGIPIVTPLFNGMFWDGWNMPLDTIERIEIVRGPGAAVWGSRAENGVINIITKSANTSNPSTISLGTGNEHQASAYVTKGLKINEYSGINIYSKIDTFDSSVGADGEPLHDGRDVVSFGGRADLEINNQNSLKIVTHTYIQNSDLDVTVPILKPRANQRIQGYRNRLGSILSGTWSNKPDAFSETVFKASNYYEDSEDSFFKYNLYNLDLDFQHHRKVSDKHDLSFGLSSRLYSDDIDGSWILDFEPRNRTLAFYRGFFQDEISMFDNELIATIGARFEQNSQVNFNLLPTTRLLWHVLENTSLWGAVSYTVGTPSRVYDDLKSPVGLFKDPATGLDTFAILTGNRNIDAEKLWAFELGMRSQLSPEVYLDFSSFYFHYHNLITEEPRSPFFNANAGNPYQVLPLQYDNNYMAETYGAETSFNWRIRHDLKIIGTYSYFAAVANNDGSSDPRTADFIENPPTHVASLRTQFDITTQVEFDTILRFVDRLRYTEIPSYLEMDLRLGWRPNKDWSFNLIGRNLLQQSHPEFKSWTYQYPMSEVERSFFVQANYNF